MMNQFWLRMFLGCCILASLFAAVEKNNRGFNSLDTGENHGFHISKNSGFQNTAFHSVETVRQCSCKEVQQCFHSVWSETNCTYQDGSSLELGSEGRELEFRDKCSAEKVKDYCTLEGNEFISISDVGYISTKNLRRQNEQFCFNQNMIKCFKSHGCDIIAHNIVLKKIHGECNKETFKWKI
uniref:Uncharacterized protein n=1 Tax=Panagrolaimus sp. PS1159 TaxID=55785 RepID=A0AC35G940_9BILA